jgi:hypothetical protein
MAWPPEFLKGKRGIYTSDFEIQILKVRFTLIVNARATENTLR